VAWIEGGPGERSAGAGGTALQGQKKRIYNGPPDTIRPRYGIDRVVEKKRWELMSIQYIGEAARNTQQQQKNCGGDLLAALFQRQKHENK